MSAKRKTADIEEIKKFANEQLARLDPDATDDFKAGICSMVEHVLVQANNYHGFQYLYWMKQGYSEWEAAGKPDYPEKDKYVCGDMGRHARRYY